MGERFIPLKVEVKEVRRGGKWVEEKGKIALVYAPLSPSEGLPKGRSLPFYLYGDVLEISAPLLSISEGDENFKSYLLRQRICGLSYPKPQEIKFLREGEGSPLKASLCALQNILSDRLKAALPGLQGSLAQALLLGRREGLPRDIRREFADSGMAHILAISGLHVSIVSGMLLALSSHILGRHRIRSFLPPLIFMWLYILLSGAPLSAVRAGIMASLWIGARIAGRPGSALHSLFLATAFMTAASPKVLREISFQLSFASMLGLVLLAPKIKEGLWGALEEKVEGRGREFFEFLIEISALSLGASLFALPIISLHFGRFSTLFLPSSLLALPVLPFLLLSAALCCLPLPAPALKIPAWPCWIFSSYELELAHAFSSLPSGALEFRLPIWGVILFYLLFSLPLLPSHLPSSSKRLFARAFSGMRKAKLPKIPAIWLLGGLAVAAILLWTAAVSIPDGRLHVWFLNVGEGDAILIQSPCKHYILIDGGPSPERVLKELGKRMPFWRRDLDLVVLTHPHEDHLAGLLGVLERYEIRRVLARSPPDFDSPLFREWEEMLQEKGIERIEAVEGQEIDLGRGAKMRVLNPPPILLEGTSSDADNNGIVLRLSWGEVSFLFAADIYGDGEEDLLGRGEALRSTVLKVPHHGSISSSTRSFLEAVNPKIAVISAGEDNPFGHPDPLVVSRLKEYVEGKLYLTSRDGTVECITDGRRLWVRTER